MALDQPTPDPNPIDLTTLSTLSLLESRLHRLTYLLTGDTTWTGVPNPPPKPATHDETVSRRLLKLEQSLQRLADEVPVVGDVVGLCMFSFTLTYLPCLSAPRRGGFIIIVSIHFANCSLNWK
ncbi:hypothetical protein BDV18DRAFT_138932 [Aspergillus unguis]